MRQDVKHTAAIEGLLRKLSEDELANLAALLAEITSLEDDGKRRALLSGLPESLSRPR